MSILRVATIEPEGATTTLTLGTSGDTVTSNADTIKVNTFKDAGGNTLFTSDGSGTLSSVNSAFKGGLTFISSQTASGSASLSFTSGIDSTYNEYMFVCTNINPDSDSYEFTFNGSTDTGSNYNVTKTTTYFSAHHQEDDGDAGLNYRAGDDIASGTGFQILTASIGGGADESASGIVYLFTPSSTTYVKQFYTRFSTNRSTDELWDTYIGGYFNTTSAVDAIQFKLTSGNFDGTIAMYGTG